MRESSECERSHSGAFPNRESLPGCPAGVPELLSAPTIIPSMARGWESKSVEAQIEESKADKSTPRPRSSGDAELERKRSELTLARKSVLQQLENSANERYSELLRRARSELDARIAALG